VVDDVRKAGQGDERGSGRNWASTRFGSSHVASLGAGTSSHGTIAETYVRNFEGGKTVTYRDVDPVKYAFLLARGTHSGELKRFFSESQKLLLLKQARVQNLPNGRDNRVRVLSEKLPRATDEVVRRWFSANLSMEDLLPAKEVLADLSLYDEMGERIPEEQEKRLARSALIHLFEEEPPADLLEFLKRRPGSATPHRAAPVDDETSTRPEEVARSSNSESEFVEARASNNQFASLLSALIMGDEFAIDEALAPLSQQLQTLVNALASVKSGEVERARSLAATLDAQSKEFELIQRAIALARLKPGKVDAIVPGLRVNVPQLLDGSAEVGVLDVIGVYSAHTDKVVFLKPIGLVIGQKVFRLRLEDRARLFPESGDVMSYREPGRHLPRSGELARWIVEERDATSGKTRFHYVKEASPVVEVLNVPFPSSAPDEVRGHIKVVMAARAVAGPHPLFSLADGVIIWPPRGADPKRDDGYDQAWQSWGSLDAWLFEGRQFAFGVPQLPSSHLDLSPLETTFKKLIKNIGDEQKPPFTRNQLRDLGQLIRAQDAGDIAFRAKRVADAVDNIRFDAEAIQELLPMLVKREEIQARIDEMVSARVEERLKEKAGIVADIESAKSRHATLQREIKELERAVKKQRSDVESSVRETFAKAIREGVATLAQSELIKFLASSNQASASTTQTDRQDLPSELDFYVSSEVLTRAEGVAQLMRLGLGKRRADVLVELLDVVSRSGGCLVLRGIDARQYAKVLGRIDSASCGFLEVPMGLVSSSYVARAMKQAGGLRSIVVQNADLSPINVYGMPIIDALVASAVSDGVPSYKVVLTCAGGEMALSMPHLVSRIAVFVDMDKPWNQEERTLEELDESDIPLMKPIVDKLNSELAMLEGAVRRSVEGLIVYSMVDLRT
jgi:hypothetical protein